MAQQTVTTQEMIVQTVDIENLTRVMTRTLPEGGLDRMTPERIEEMLAVPALTAHL